jgi:hypothetical protein
MTQVGIYAQSMLGVHTHANAGQGGQIDPETGLNPQPKVDFGDGSDGDVVVAANTALTRDMSYNNLTINAGQTLGVGGYKIRVRHKLTLIAGCAVISEESAATVMNGFPAVAGAGGPGGGPAYINRRPCSSLPTKGAAGGDGGGAGVTDETGGIAPDMDVVNVATLFEGRLWAGAGGGGGGGAILIFYEFLSGGGIGTLNVAGGSGGTSFGGLADGIPGAAGFAYAQKIGV